MEILNSYNKHYIRVDQNGFITYAFSDAFDTPLDGDICINEQGGRQLEILGDTNPALTDINGCHLYKYINGATAKTTEEDIAVELDSLVSLESVQIAKIQELSKACEDTIIAGIDVTTSLGIEHFSLNEKDQINILTQLSMVDKGATQAPYHSDDNDCRLFSADEIKALATASYNYVTYMTTYFNRLKDWVKRSTTKAEVDAIVFGASLPTDLDDQLIAITGTSSIK